MGSGSRCCSGVWMACSERRRGRWPHGGGGREGWGEGEEATSCAAGARKRPTPDELLCGHGGPRAEVRVVCTLTRKGAVGLCGACGTANAKDPKEVELCGSRTHSIYACSPSMPQPCKSSSHAQTKVVLATTNVQGHRPHTTVLHARSGILQHEVGPLVTQKQLVAPRTQKGQNS